MTGVISDGAQHPGDIMRRLAALEAQLREMQAARGLSASSIGSGGLTIDSGGQLRVVAASGETVFLIGLQQHGDVGMTVRREDGSLAFLIRKPFSPTDAQLIQVFDNEDNIIFAEEVFGAGLGEPRLELPMRPIAAATGALSVGPDGPERVTSSATFVDLFAYDGIRQNQWYRPIIVVRCSDGTTAGEIQFVEKGTGSVLNGFFQPPWVGAIPTGTTAYTPFEPPFGLSLLVEPKQPLSLALQARRTAGAGSLTVAVRRSIAGGA
ncbi:MAG: hypothetical protein ACRD0W_00235 [Acidimicrobiales bacterium]